MLKRSLVFHIDTPQSGKTTTMLATEYYYRKRGHKPLIIKHLDENSNVDSNGFGDVPNAVVTGKHQALHVPNINQNYLDNFVFDMLLVDDVHKFSEEDVLKLKETSCARKIPVICYGLLKDENNKYYPTSLKLMNTADYIYDLSGRDHRWHLPTDFTSER